MYFDAVVTKDECTPLANGTREEILEWIKNNPDREDVEVVDGARLQYMSIEEYKNA